MPQIRSASRLLTNFSDVSWSTFKEACDLRKDEISERIWEENGKGVPLVCITENKNLLERVARKRKIEEISLAEKSDTGTAELQSDSRQTRSSLQAIDMKECAICQTVKTDSKDRRRKEKLTTCETMQAGRTLLEAAKLRGDQRLSIALRDQDPIAIELCYHRTCYRTYTNLK